MSCFSSGEDFYSVVGMQVFDKYDCSPIKDAEDSFAKKYPKLRALTKEFTLATVYGTTAPKMVMSFKDKAGVDKTVDEAQEIIDNYLDKFPDVHDFMLSTHKIVKAEGRITSIFGRPRRLPEAKNITSIYGNVAHARLPYEARQPLNLSVNFRCQSTAASIINRSAIAFLALVKEAGIKDCYLVLNVHDELVVECRIEDADDVSALLQYAMETTCHLPGVALEAKPVISKNLRDLK
jgi:DNA polymerase-1